MLYGDELKRAIEDLGLNPRQFAERCIKPNGKALSRTAIDDFIRKSGIEASQDAAWAVEHALKKSCRTCGQYTEKKDAWNHSKTKEEGADRKTR